jgi:nucleotide-binding universal stress UspA family protein
MDICQIQALSKQKEDQMYKNILIPLDGSELAECVLPHVESIAKGCGVQNVVFLRAVEPFHTPSNYYGTILTEEDIKRIDQDNKTAAEDYLNQLVNRMNPNEVTIHSEIIVGKAPESIAEYAIKTDIDLIIIATHGRSGISRWIWGSVADRILRSSCVPVLMIRAPGCVPGI